MMITVAPCSRASLCTRVSPCLHWQGYQGIVHGGVISTLADTAGGMAVWSALRDGQARVSTIDLRVDYLRPGRPETLFGFGRVIRLGNRVGVAELRAYHTGGDEEPVAVGTGVYNIRRAKAEESREMWKHVEP